MSDEFSRKLLKRPDIVLASLRKGYQWGQENIKVVMSVCLLFLGLVAAGIAIDQWKKSREDVSLSAFYTAELKPDTKVFEEMSRKYPKSKGALLAYFKLGELNAGEKKWKEAIHSYESALRLSKDRFYRLLAYYNLGYMHEMAGECEKAISYFREITDIKKTRILLWTFGARPNAFWLSSAYFGVGRCYEKLARFSEAKETYLRVADEFPDTSYADKARAYARLVRSE